jgi:peptidoglycan/LPS O-acetylase OafA/YrhL
MSKMKKSSHFPAIDGLRGIFALAVLTAHVNINWLPHTHILMDIFFTISAFLITLALIKNIEKNGKISLLTFTKRRLLRLYPALIFCVVPYTIVAYFLVENFRFIIDDAFLTLIYASNFSKLSNYVYPHFFGHTWSLAIEEHFYIIWPSLLALLLIRKEVWKNSAKILLAIMLVSIAWRIYLVDSGAEWSRLYYASDTRIDAFVIGGLLAFIQPSLNYLYRNMPFFKNILIALSFCILLSLYFWDPKVKYYFVWQQPVILFLSCALIFVITRNDKNIIERTLDSKILQWVGVRCYGIYLWHWPIIWFLISNTEISKPALFLIVLPFSLFMAWFSYKYIEEPILRRRPKMPNS